MLSITSEPRASRATATARASRPATLEGSLHEPGKEYWVKFVRSNQATLGQVLIAFSVGMVGMVSLAGGPWGLVVGMLAFVITYVGIRMWYTSEGGT